MGSNTEKSFIAIAILKKLPFLNGTKFFSHFDGSNNFSPTVYVYFLFCFAWDKLCIRIKIIDYADKVCGFCAKTNIWILFWLN